MAHPVKEKMSGKVSGKQSAATSLNVSTNSKDEVVNENKRLARPNLHIDKSANRRQTHVPISVDRMDSTQSPNTLQDMQLSVIKQATQEYSSPDRSSNASPTPTGQRKKMIKKMSSLNKIVECPTSKKNNEYLMGDVEAQEQRETNRIQKINFIGGGF